VNIATGLSHKFESLFPTPRTVNKYQILGCGTSWLFVIDTRTHATIEKGTAGGGLERGVQAVTSKRIGLLDLDSIDNALCVIIHRQPCLNTFVITVRLS
jgi:hypothetical protein